MKKLFLLMMPLLTLMQLANAQQLTVDCGDNVVICEGLIDGVHIGQNVTIVNAVSSTTFKWSCEPHEGLHGKKYHASFYLNDTTVLNPYFIEIPNENVSKFYLQVTDESGDEAIDSLLVYLEKFVVIMEYPDVKPSQNPVFIPDELGIGSIFPFVQFAVCNEDTVELPAYFNLQQNDTIDIITIDSVGCVDKTTLYASKILISSIENEISNNTLSFWGKSLIFNDESEKLIRVFSDNGRLIFSAKTNDMTFDLSQLGNVGHCVCEVFVGNERYSFNVIMP